MPACNCAINTWTLKTCGIPGSTGRTHCDATCQTVFVLSTPAPVTYTSHLWHTWFNRENHYQMWTLHTCDIHFTLVTYTLHLWHTLYTCDAPGSRGRTHSDATSRLMSVQQQLNTSYLVQQGEPTATPHVGLCLCYPHLNASYLFQQGEPTEMPHASLCVCYQHLNTSYLVQQGEPIATPHASLCLCYQHLNTSYLVQQGEPIATPHASLCLCYQ